MYVKALYVILQSKLDTICIIAITIITITIYCYYYAPQCLVVSYIYFLLNKYTLTNSLRHYLVQLHSNINFLTPTRCPIIHISSVLTPTALSYQTPRKLRAQSDKTALTSGASHMCWVSYPKALRPSTNLGLTKTPSDVMMHQNNTQFSGKLCIYSHQFIIKDICEHRVRSRRVPISRQF